MKTAAKIISIIFHPVFFATYATILMFALPGFLSLYPFNYKKTVILVIFMITAVIPMLVILIMLNLGKISSLEISDKKERVQAVLITVVMYLSGYFIVQNLPGGIPVFVGTYLLCSVISLIILFAATFYFKISIHSASVGGFIGFFFIFMLKVNMPYTLFTINGFEFTKLMFFSLILFVSALIISSRLYLKAHTPAQVSAGFFAGLIPGLLSLAFY